MSTENVHTRIRECIANLLNKMNTYVKNFTLNLLHYAKETMEDTVTCIMLHHSVNLRVKFSLCDLFCVLMLKT